MCSQLAKIESCINKNFEKKIGRAGCIARAPSYLGRGGAINYEAYTRVAESFDLPETSKTPPFHLYRTQGPLNVRCLAVFTMSPPISPHHMQVYCLCGPTHMLTPAAKRSKSQWSTSARCPHKLSIYIHNGQKPWSWMQAPDWIPWFVMRERKTYVTGYDWLNFWNYCQYTNAVLFRIAMKILTLAK